MPARHGRSRLKSPRHTDVRGQRDAGCIPGGSLWGLVQLVLLACLLAVMMVYVGWTYLQFQGGMQTAGGHQEALHNHLAQKSTLSSLQRSVDILRQRLEKVETVSFGAHPSRFKAIARGGGSPSIPAAPAGANPKPQTVDAKPDPQLLASGTNSHSSVHSAASAEDERAKVLVHKRPLLSPDKHERLDDVKTSTRGNYKRALDQLAVCKWMQERMKRVLPKWLEARDALEDLSWAKVTQRNIAILLGNVDQGTSAALERGAPSGDYMQWTDLIAVMALLGHQLKIITMAFERKDLNEYEKLHPKDPFNEFDFIFVDYAALGRLRIDLGAHSKHYQQLLCKVRVVDAFGTEQKFIDQYFAPAGNTRIDLRQCWTLHPCCPQNTFLGFGLNVPSKLPHSDTKKNQVLVWGKQENYFGSRVGVDCGFPLPVIQSYLKAMSQKLKIIATVGSYGSRGQMGANFPFVQNRGYLDPAKYEDILVEARALVGLGYPKEGISFLYAWTRGVPFVNPVYKPPFVEPHKPHERPYTSQVPYCETVGKPFVYAVDPRDPDNVTRVVKELLEAPPLKPHVDVNWAMPTVFKRVQRLLEHQVFCPLSAGSKKDRRGKCLCPYCETCVFKDTCSC